MTTREIEFDAMGCRIRLIVEHAAAAEDSHRWLHDFDARMSRFRSHSELSQLNRDPRPVVPASALLCSMVSAGLWAARQTEGLVDPTLVRQLERAGYSSSRTGSIPAPLADALAAAPARAPAHPSPDAGWQLVEVDAEHGVIRRPPGLRIDSGGAGKGLAADALAHRLSGSRFAIDCGGDVRVSGPEPFDLEIEHPLTCETALAFRLADGAVATSGLATRIWRTADGGYAHHLIDPATGQPAWTGLIQTTALAPSALEAETLSKAALLSGPEAAGEILAPYGGALIHDDGELELVGALRFDEVAA